MPHFHAWKNSLAEKFVSNIVSLNSHRNFQNYFCRENILKMFQESSWILIIKNICCELNLKIWYNNFDIKCHFKNQAFNSDCLVTILGQENFESNSEQFTGFMKFNSQAGGMAVARPYGFEIDFVRNPISGSAAWFFVIILKFIFTHIF